MKEFAPLKRWFGPFGGGFCADDITNCDQERYADSLSHLIIAPSFQHRFNEILEFVLPSKEFSVHSIQSTDGRTIHTVQNLGWYYNLAGQLTIAIETGKKKICAGTYRSSECRILAAVAKELSLDLTLVLSRSQAADTSLKEALQAKGCQIDDKTCVQLPDSPYAYALYHCESASDTYVLILEANFGPYPSPALVNLFSGLYGDILQKKVIPLSIDGIVVPITTGTEAVSVLQQWVAHPSQSTLLMTSEYTVSEEYHTIDMGTYTLATRSSDRESVNTSLSPLLASWWRSASVRRLGCDEYRPLDIAPLLKKGMTPSGARAALLALQDTTCENLLIPEVPYE